MRLLDLFCGAGGAAMGYHRAGFEVTGVDNKPQPNYPFEFVLGDALEYVTEHGAEFDVIHASPPCQAYSEMQKIHNNISEHPQLIEPIRESLIKSGKIYIIENVKNAPLINPIILCGTYFGLNIARHRLFESNFDLFTLWPVCNHQGLYSKWRWEDKTKPENWRGEREKLSEAMGIDWFMTRPEVREAIPPAYTEFIGKRIMEVDSESR